MDYSTVVVGDLTLIECDPDDWHGVYFGYKGQIFETNTRGTALALNEGEILAKTFNHDKIYVKGYTAYNLHDIAVDLGGSDGTHL